MCVGGGGTGRRGGGGERLRRRRLGKLLTRPILSDTGREGGTP